MSELKSTNPKDIIGSDKIPLHLVPYAMKVLAAIGLFNGAAKYGRANYRATGVRGTVYLDAIERHLEGIKNGEEVDPEDGVPHLCGLLASAAVYADAWAHEYLVDDRMPRPTGFRSWVDGMTAHIPRLRALHEGRAPRHYTIQDTTLASGGEYRVSRDVLDPPDSHHPSEFLVDPVSSYEGVTREEDRLGCSFLRFLPEFGARK